jgi:hypothetical protein
MWLNANRLGLAHELDPVAPCPTREFKLSLASIKVCTVLDAPAGLTGNQPEIWVNDGNWLIQYFGLND